MGKKAKSSRKGKKEWRSNISSADVDEYFEKATKDALSGGSLTHLPDQSLFFIDKDKDFSIKRKIEKHREKVLRCDSILQRSTLVQKVPSSKRKPKKSKAKVLPKEKLNTIKTTEADQDSNATVLDIWDNKEGDTKAKKKSKRSVIPAVEIEPPGCSFNPSTDDHQDSLAVAVADEMQKVYRAELGPQPVPRRVHGTKIDEEDMYFLDVDDTNDEDLKNDEDLENDDNVAHEHRPLKNKRLTQVELNRRARRKEQLKAESEAKKQENISKEIDCLPDIIKEITKEDEEKHKRLVRRTVARLERLRKAPPRLGKHKFEPEPVQVLLTEELTGSIRTLKGCCTLARDRFKSLEKRGLVVPGGKRKRR
ncbi:uncharacterized protein At2g40430 [Amborella trichopoda]|uniref:uncharacterized protein At2g40430 n=1 Tax=Amborella trichopoda TaxID=13333 RepID=UPI0005D3A3E9|nr:uncharacterized protein At2g40430 [Amborella trichopoda]|eukprot:XP_011622639.1 uncharacterized protein At2g40430 [Amborella trichopoda]